MRIWLVQTGEQMPSDGEGTRLLRTALLAKVLVERGHEVTYWNATFNHQRNFQRYHETTRVRQENSYNAIFLYGRPYSKNISISRILSHRENAAEFSKLAPSEPAPDVILCGFPTIEMADAVARFAISYNIPYVIDARDMWPEVIEENISKILQYLAYPVLQLWRSNRNYAFFNADSIVGVSDKFVDWACSVSKRSRRNCDQAILLGVDNTDYSEDALAIARKYWDNQIGPHTPDCVTFLMAGNLGGRVDIKTAVDAAAQVKLANGKKIKLVVCGTGDLEDYIKNIASDNENVYYAGWRDGVQLRTLSERCVAGILAYNNSPDLSSSFPNKVGEYLYYGLPIITPLQGEVGKLLKPYGLIIEYAEKCVESAISAYTEAAMMQNLNMKMHAKKCYKAYFDSKKIYEKYALHLEKITKYKNGG